MKFDRQFYVQSKIIWYSGAHKFILRNSQSGAPLQVFARENLKDMYTGSSFGFAKPVISAKPKPRSKIKKRSKSRVLRGHEVVPWAVPEKEGVEGEGKTVLPN